MISFSTGSSANLIFDIRIYIFPEMTNQRCLSVRGISCLGQADQQSM